MKKLSLVIMCAAALVLVSCGGNSNKKGNGKAAETKTSVADAVDLGLSVKWATHNVGTTAPEGYGDYFAWGETTPKNDYSWATYKWSNGGSSSSFSKYNSSDQIVILQTEDDAAACRRIFDGFRRGEAPWFDRTSGLAFRTLL